MIKPFMVMYKTNSLMPRDVAEHFETYDAAVKFANTLNVTASIYELKAKTIISRELEEFKK